MELVTGRKGVAHITSQQDRMKHQGMFGEGAYILKTGQMLEPQVQTSNEIRIRDGALMVQGALSCVKTNSYDAVTIQNGTQGMKRIDLICWQYTYDAEQDVESAEWVVIQGTPAESDPQQPSYTDGDIQQGDSPVQVPVFAVELDGINVTGVTTLLPTAPTLEELNSKITPLTDSASRQPAQNYTVGQKYYFDADGWVYFECQMTNANGYCRFRIFNESDAEIFGFQANATATQKVAMQSGVYPVKKGWYTQLGQYQSAISQKFYFIKE